ncbi:hypothetical protein FXO37_31496 [Capsicum annuum]|nr:hypothetical protein FXO37_31496 [Capsicum annuum]
MLQVYHLYVYALLDPEAFLSFVTPDIAVDFGVNPKILADPFSVSTPVVEEATWEAEVDVRTKYPDPFSSNLDSAQETVARGESPRRLAKRGSLKPTTPCQERFSKAHDALPREVPACVFSAVMFHIFKGANTLPTGVTGWTPTQFIIRFMKKVLYAREGAKSMMDWTFADFPWKVRVDVDGVDIEVPDNEDENYENFDSQSMHDKMLEVVSISGTWHLGKLQVTGVPNMWGSRKLRGLHRAPEKFSIVAARNPVCNLALMVGTTDILDWCYFKAFGSKEKSNFTVAPSAEHLALFSDKLPISHALDKFVAVAARNPVCNLSLMVQKNEFLTVLSSSGLFPFLGMKAMEPEASTTQSMDNNATNVILAPLETISRDMARLNADFGTMREDMASMKGCVGSM